METIKPKRLIKFAALLDKSGGTRSSVYQGMANGTFPKSVKTGKRSIAWVEDEIDEHIDRLIAARDSTTKDTSEEHRGAIEEAGFNARRISAVRPAAKPTCSGASHD